jgi:hypothetical protein
MCEAGRSSSPKTLTGFTCFEERLHTGKWHFFLTTRSQVYDVVLILKLIGVDTRSGWASIQRARSPKEKARRFRAVFVGGQIERNDGGYRLTAAPISGESNDFKLSVVSIIDRRFVSLYGNKCVFKMLWTVWFLEHHHAKLKIIIHFSLTSCWRITSYLVNYICFHLPCHTSWNETRATLVEQESRILQALHTCNYQNVYVVAPPNDVINAGTMSFSGTGISGFASNPNYR